MMSTIGRLAIRNTQLMSCGHYMAAEDQSRADI